MIFAIDFDGTMVTHDYPRLGKEVGATKVCKLLVEQGHQIILYTMRSGKELAAAVAWCEAQGIELWAVNENPTQSEWTASPKVYAHHYIDDAAIGVPLVIGKHYRPYVDWGLVYELLRRKQILKPLHANTF